MAYANKADHLAYRLRWLQAKREAGQCTTCPAPTSQGYRQCFKCRVRAAERYRARKARAAA